MGRNNKNRKAAKKQKEAQAAAKPKQEETKQEASVSLKDQGNKAFIEHNYTTAEQLFTQAIQEDPKNHVCFSNRSATFCALKNYDKALEDAEMVIKLQPDWPKGYFRKGNALEQLLRYAEANQTYNLGLKKNPTDATLLSASKSLAAVLAELKISEKELSTDNPEKDKFEMLISWLKEGGARFPKLYLQYYSEDYRGVHTLTKIPADEIVLYVPFKHIMTSDIAKASAIGQKIIQAQVELRSKHSFLASYLLQEREKKDTFWRPYLNVLPEKYANMPLFFDENLLSWLKGSMCMEKIADRIDSLRKEFDTIRRKVPEFNNWLQEDFVWARLVVITRIFGLIIDGNKTDGLVPYADMLNHKRPRETKWTFDDADYGFIITSLHAIPRGAQIYDSYGRKCNSRFFVNYGFALENNNDNEAVVRITLPESDPHYKMKIRFLGGKEDQARREYQVPSNYREKKCKELFSFLRFIHARDSELMTLSSAESGFRLGEIQPMSIRNELAVLQHLGRAAKEMMARFDTTLEEDNKLLEGETLPMFSNERNCVIMRRGEKQVLQLFVDLQEKGSELLKMSWKDLKKIAQKAQYGSTRFDIYVATVISPLVKMSGRG